MREEEGSFKPMPEQPGKVFFLCPNCYTAGEAAGACPVCEHEMLSCRPGDPDDPCRKPLIDSAGQIRTRAPRWWLEKRLPALFEALKRI
jgi:hypothetical protein